MREDELAVVVRVQRADPRVEHLHRVDAGLDLRDQVLAHHLREERAELERQQVELEMRKQKRQRWEAKLGAAAIPERFRDRTLDNYNAATPELIFILAFVFFFELGNGVIPWLYAAEILSNSGMSAAVVTANVFTLLISSLA